MSSVAIHQPNYFPWLGYFYKIHRSDEFVFLDDAQFSNKGMHNYLYVKTPQGSLRMKVPIRQRFGDPIKDVEIQNSKNWKRDHLKTIELNYKRAKYFKEIYEDLEFLISKDYQNLSTMNIEIISFICKKFGINSKFHQSSTFSISSTREERLIDLCSKLNAEIYYSGYGAKAYQKEDNFFSRGISLKYLKFVPFEYEQLWGAFESNVSIIDYLMNCGYDWGRVLNYQKGN